MTLTGEALTRWKYQRYMQDYLATVQSVDDNVGRVLDVARHGAASRATRSSIYTSDQGFFLGDHGLFDKRFMYEESLRMPFLVRWPAAIKPGRRATRSASTSTSRRRSSSAAGLPASAGHAGPQPAAGAARPHAGATGGRRCTTATTTIPGDHNTRAHYGVRTRTHKLIYFWKKDQWELFDLVNDPHELHNLYGAARAGGADRDAEGGAARA